MSSHFSEASLGDRTNTVMWLYSCVEKMEPGFHAWVKNDLHCLEEFQYSYHMSLSCNWQPVVHYTVSTHGGYLEKGQTQTLWTHAEDTWRKARLRHCEHTRRIPGERTDSRHCEHTRRIPGERPDSDTVNTCGGYLEKGQTQTLWTHAEDTWRKARLRHSSLKMQPGCRAWVHNDLHCLKEFQNRFQMSLCCTPQPGWPSVHRESGRHGVCPLVMTYRWLKHWYSGSCPALWPVLQGQCCHVPGITGSVAALPCAWYYRVRAALPCAWYCRVRAALCLVLQGPCCPVPGITGSVLRCHVPGSGIAGSALRCPVPGITGSVLRCPVPGIAGSVLPCAWYYRVSAALPCAWYYRVSAALPCAWYYRVSAALCLVLQGQCCPVPGITGSVLPCAWYYRVGAKTWCLGEIAS